MDEIQAYLDELLFQQGLAIDRFGNLTAIEKDIVNSSFSWLVNNLDIKKGMFVVTEDLPALLNQFVDTITGTLLSNKSYEKNLSNYLSDLDIIGKNIKDFQISFNGVDYEKAGIKQVQKAVIDTTIDQYTENGLNTHFAQPLKDLIYRNVLTGLDVPQAKQYLNEYILSGKDQSGKLGQYLTQTAQQGVDSYTGAINTKLAQTFDYTGYIISGSIIKTSSTQCKYAIDHSKNGYLTNEDWQKVFAIARENKKAPLIEGTNLNNLDINKLHWGCRHLFTPVIIIN